MNQIEPPTPIELATLAANIHGAKAANNPKKAVHDAYSLWLAANQEIIDRERSEDAAMLEAYNGLQGSKLIEIRSENGDSPAREWINRHAKSIHDQFKTVRRFVDAWLEFRPHDEFYYSRRAKADGRGTPARWEAEISELEEFLLYRKKGRSGEKAAQRRKKKNPVK